MITNFKYEHKGKTYILSEFDYKKIMSQLTNGGPVDTGGLTLYPIYSDPDDQELRSGDKITRPATVIRDGCAECARWYWQVCEHQKKHTNCRFIENGLCARKVVRYLTWSREDKKWELSPMVNPATPAQIKVLDNN